MDIPQNSKLNMATINSKGQVLIPQRLRDKYNLLPESRIAFIEIDNKLVLVSEDESLRYLANTASADLAEKLSPDELTRVIELAKQVRRL
jgi:AbrB family looped-hinge helix DNA binding protein